MTCLRSMFGILSILVLAAACGNGSSYNSPTSPGGSSNPPAGSNATTISINGIAGNQSFSPNPATGKAGQAIQWMNANNVTHRIVADNGGFDTGNITAGSSSANITVAQAGSYPYHCSIHPSMVGYLKLVL